MKRLIIHFDFTLQAVAVWTVLSWYPCASRAQQDTVASKVRTLENVEVVGSRKPQQVRSLAPVQTFGQQEIEMLGLQDMADAVRRFAGANVKDYGGIGGMKTVSVRNMGAAHTAVSYDGIAVSNCQAGQIDIGRFSLDNVSMLSLAVGQQDDLLQSARMYASAGVLNIETQQPFFAEDERSAFRLRLRGGSFGYVTPSMRWWQQLGERTKLSVDASYMRADGTYPFTLTNGKYQTREKRYNSSIYTWQGEANLYHTFRDGGDLQLKGYYFYSKRGLPGAVTLYNPYSDEQLWDENTFVQARYKKRFSSRWSLLAQAKYNHSWNLYTDEGAEYATGHYRAVHRQDEGLLSVTALYQPDGHWSFSLAQDGTVNTLRSNMGECPFPVRWTSLTALNIRFRQEWITVNGSLVGTYLTEHVDEGYEPNDFHRLAPSLAFSLKPFAGESLYLRMMYKSTFRTPSFNDLYYYRLGNRHLRPETADEYNVGITWNCGWFSALDHLTLTVDGYYNSVTDKIVACPTTYAWLMANYGTVHVKGLDVALHTAFPLGQKLRFSLAGAYTWQKAVDEADPTSKSYRHQLPYTPEHSGNLSLTLESPWVNVGYSLVGVGKRYCLPQNIKQNEIDGYVEHTLSLSREFRLGGSRLQVQAEIINLTDQQYDVIKYYPMPGRSWRLSGTWQF